MKRVRVEAEPVIAKDLEPGELFSTRSNFYWHHIDGSGSIGEKVWLRTNESAESAGDEYLEVYRLRIVVEQTVEGES